MSLQIAYLENLPNEILNIIVEYLRKPEIKRVSSVNKRMRDISHPFLFRNFRFTFSKKGLNQLKEILNSKVSYYIISIQYVVPELLNPSDNSHNDWFRFRILTHI
jgi:hypothetical protein